MTEIDRDIGRLEAEMSEVVKKLEKLDDDVEMIKTTLAEARGGWRTLMWVGGSSGVLGGLIAKYTPWLTTLPK